MLSRRLAFALSLLVPALASAHGLWLERRGDAIVLHRGHPGETLILPAARVQSMRCVQESGTRDLRATAEVDPTELRVEARCAALSASYDGGFWCLTPDGEKNLPRSQVPDAVKCWSSRQLAKWIDPRSPLSGAPVGEALEIVPAGDLSRARKGDKVTMRVLLHGEPVAGAVVSVGHKTIGETDRGGEVRLRIRSKQLETITAALRQPLASPEADALVLEASLSFEVAP